MKKFLLLIMIILSNYLNGQKIHFYSVAGKITANPYTSRIIEGVDVNTFANKLCYTLSYQVGEEFSLEIFRDFPIETYRDLSIRVGGYHLYRRWRIQYQSGLSYVKGIKRTKELDLLNSTFLTNYYFTEKFETIGIPLVFGWRYLPFKFMGIGMDFFVNINLERSFFRPCVVLEIGLLRAR